MGNSSSLEHERKLQQMKAIAALRADHEKEMEARRVK